MHPSSDTPAHTVQNPSGNDGTPSGDPSAVPASWLDALFALLDSRVGIFRLESRAAAHAASRKAVKIAVAAALLFFGWVLLLSGLVAVISHYSGCPWHWVAIGAAVVHLAAAAILARSATVSGPPSFPATRAEFKKDREWIENLKNNRKSSV